MGCHWRNHSSRLVRRQNSVSVSRIPSPPLQKRSDVSLPQVQFAETSPLFWTESSFCPLFLCNFLAFLLALPKCKTFPTENKKAALSSGVVPNMKIAYENRPANLKRWRSWFLYPKLGEYLSFLYLSDKIILIAGYV
jgi:hypothetical protein